MILMLNAVKIKSPNILPLLRTLVLVNIDGKEENEKGNTEKRL